jgi:hypothetical protein
MNLADKDIERFRQAWREEFNEEITPAFARQRFNEILDLYRALQAHKQKSSRSSPSSRSQE